MPQLALAVVGAEMAEGIAAAYGLTAGEAVAFGMTAGQIGFAAGSVAGSVLFAPTAKGYGPRLGDLKAAQATYGSVIPYVEGHPRIGGVIVWASDRREIAATQSSGKGGGSEQTTYTYEQDFLFMLSENVLGAVRRVWRDGELVWTVADDADAASLAASDTSELWDALIFYSGAADQLPDPTYEAVVGVGNAPAYRTRTTVMLKGVKLGGSGQLRNFTFEVVPDAAYTDSVPAFYQLAVGTAYETSCGQQSAIEAQLLAAYNAANDGGWAIADGYPQYVDGVPTVLKLSKVSGDGYYATTQSGVTSGPQSSPTTACHAYVAALAENNPTVENTGPGYFYVSNTDTVCTWGGPIEYFPSHQNTLTIHTTGSYTFYSEDFAYSSCAGSGLALTEPTLQHVVERQCLRAGLSLDDVDASALATRYVRALGVTQISSPRQIIDMLAAAYLFSATESDVIRFTFRGGASVASIPYADLVAEGSAEPLPIAKGNDLELPVQVFVKFSNVLDDYQDGAETSDRLISSGQNTSALELPLGLTPTESKRLADAHLLDAIVGAVRFGPFNLTLDYARLEPADVVTLEDSQGTAFRVRLTKQGKAGGRLACEGVLDDASAMLSEASTSSSGYGNSVGIKLPVDTQALLLDMPIVRDGDSDQGFYVVAKPATDVAFPGAVLLKSADDVTFETAQTMETAGVFGTASTVLGAGVTGVFDEKNSITVDVGAGQLASVTRDVLLNGRGNALLVGDEVIQFRTATLVSAGVYTLTGLLRGRLGTEWAVGTHGAAECVVLLDGALRRVAMSNSELGVAQHWKAVTLGRTAATATSQAFTDQAVGLKPRAPVDLRVARDASGNITVTLQRRTRLATRLIGALGVSCPLGEQDERYQLDVYATSGYATVKRTLSASTPSFSYSAANQVSDFGGNQATVYLKAYQLSAAVGRGYAATAQG